MNLEKYANFVLKCRFLWIVFAENVCYNIFIISQIHYIIIIITIKLENFRLTVLRYDRIYINVLNKIKCEVSCQNYL